jgi:hypothetical protein
MSGSCSDDQCPSSLYMGSRLYDKLLQIHDIAFLGDQHHVNWAVCGNKSMSICRSH